MKLLMLVGGVGLGVFLAMFALSKIFLLSLVLVLVVGYLFQIFMTSNFTLVQIISPDYIRGRVLSIRMIAVGIGPAGMVMLGAAAERWGADKATAVMGLASTVLLLIVLLSISSVRRVERELGVEPAATAQAGVRRGGRESDACARRPRPEACGVSSHTSCGRADRRRPARSRRTGTGPLLAR